MLETLCLDSNSLIRVPRLGSAPRLQRLWLRANPNLVLDADAAARLPVEAPALQELFVGGPVAAVVSLARSMPQLRLL